MLTASKRRAIGIGFVIVAVAILGLGLRYQSHRTPELPLAARVAAVSTPQPALPPAVLNSDSRPPAAQDKASSAQAAKPNSADAVAEPPHFDVVRVEPTGETVLAGQGAPNSSVDLLASGKVVAQAPTDASGHFVILPPALTPGDHALSLRQPNASASPTESTQSVTVSVPQKGQGQVVVALAEPGRATNLLSPPPAASPAPSPQAAPSPSSHATITPAPRAAVPPATKDTALAVRSVELENGNGFYASGAAAPGTKLHVYLNNSHLADVAAGVDGAWSVKIRKGLTGGHYVVRADATAGAKVTARVEVPFDVPVAMAETTMPVAKAAGSAARSVTPPASVATGRPPSPGTVPPAPSASTVSTATNAVIDEVSTAMVHSGDNLWDISRIRLGQGRRYTRIYAANLAQIRDPSLIYPGQVFVLPTQND